jgi:hypothetical protein
MTVFLKDRARQLKWRDDAIKSENRKANTLRKDLVIIKAEVDDWKSRFKALTGWDSPDAAGNEFISLKAEKERLERVAKDRSYLSEDIDFWVKKDVEKRIAAIRDGVENLNKQPWVNDHQKYILKEVLALPGLKGGKK